MTINIALIGPGVKSARLTRSTKTRFGQSAKIADELMPLLKALYPKTFSRFRPLKLGIDRDLKAELPELSNKKIDRVLWFYTSSRSYLSALRIGADRYGLDGNPAGTVTENEAEFARKAFKLRFGKK